MWLALSNIPTQSVRSPRLKQRVPGYSYISLIVIDWSKEYSLIEVVGKSEKN